MIFRSEHTYVPQLPLEDPDWLPSEVVIRRFGVWGTFAMPLGFVAGVEARAYVQRSQWIVACPWCDQTQVTSPADPKMCCPACHNDGRSQWARVVFPDCLEAIEGVLNLRPKLDTRNWVLGETVADLEAENAQHEVA